MRGYVERLRRAEALVLSFPVWNYGYPAILKGFFDRVFLPGVSFELVNGKAQPLLHNISKVAAVTTYGGSRFRAMLMGDPPRKIVNRLMRATVKPGAPVSYLAHYSMNVSTDQSREAFHAKGRGERWTRSEQMRVLVVYCHPVPESFCAAVRDAAVEALGERGCEVRLVDLYAERFDPVMPADERRTYNEHAPADPDLAPHIEQSALGGGDPARLPDLVVRAAGHAEGLVRPRLGEGRAFALTDGGQDHAADDAYQEDRHHHHVRRAVVVVVPHRPARPQDDPARHPRQFAPGAARRCSWRTT